MTSIMDKLNPDEVSSLFNKVAEELHSRVLNELKEIQSIKSASPDRDSSKSPGRSRSKKKRSRKSKQSIKNGSI